MVDHCWQLRGVLVHGADSTRPRIAVDELIIPVGITALVGPSGSGKSSLLMLLAGALPPACGMITSPPASADRLPVFWSPDGGWWPGLTVRDHLLAVAPAAGVDDCDTLLEECGLAQRARHLPAELSAGERDRLAVARGLASGAQIVLLDEPFAHCDDTQAAGLWELLIQRVRADGRSLVYASHAPERVLGWADHAVCLLNGRMLAAGGVETLYHQPTNKEVAACLGVANWFSPVAAESWLGDAAHAGCVRPEYLLVEAQPDSSMTVTASRFHGVFTATTLRDGEAVRTVFHRSAHALAKDLRVALRLLMVVLAVILMGCVNQNPQTSSAFLAISVPPDGPRQPAPRGVAKGCGDEWVVLDTAGRVLVYGADQRVVRQWRMPEWEAGRPENATVLADGRVVVADTHYHRMVIFDRIGTVLSIFGSEGDGPGQFRWPVGVCSDTTGNLYVSEYGGNDRIQVFDRNNSFVRAFGGFSDRPGQFQRPQGICWRSGELLVADAMNNRIQRFRDDGTLLGVLGGDHPPALLFPYAVAVDAAGVITVVEYSGNRITRLDRAGTVLSRVGRAGRGEGDFATPWGMAIDDTGRTWVADTGNRRLVQVGP